MYTAGTGAEPQFTNCLFYRNDADKEDNSTRGGAIYTNRKMILLNCTLAKNWAGENNGGGGIYNTGDDADSILRNCILWRNEAGGTHNGEADQIAIAGGADVEAFESCIEDLDTLDESGHNNTPDNPQFQNFDSDNYVLKGDNCSGGNCLSFAVDDGEDDYCVDECEEDGDLNKATRKIDLEPNGEQVDMGALETQSG
ncbi:MAG: hypothetical protein FLDDKLPJ_03439 [Phycisphaerae bacterium]|nr:hypothetical protein [Phycisphaerae bacterium]